MPPSKTLGWIILFFAALLFLSDGPRMLASETIAGYPQKEKTTDQQEIKEKEKKAEKEEDIGDTMKKRMDHGESMFEILGLPTPEDYMPTPFEVVLLWLIPFSVIVAVFLLIMMITKRRHQRILAMIEKGIFPDAKAVNSYKATQFRWDVFLLLTGLILGLGGVGLSVFMMGHKGPDHWYTGIVPFLVGAALLIFYQIFYRKKNE